MCNIRDSKRVLYKDFSKSWNLSKIKHVALIDPACDFSSLKEDTLITYTPMEYIKQGYYIPNTTSYGQLSPSLTAYQEGDIVMAKVTPCFENGNIAIMTMLESNKGVGSSELFVFRSRSINTKYLFYWLQNEDFIQRACSTMTGVGGLKRVSPQFIRNCTIRVPPKNVQVRIVNYLDAKCAKIDALIAKQQEIIEKLKAYKLSVITEAVTKGLNPTVSMRDSGVDFMGEVPEHWEMVRLKFLLSHIIDCPHETPEYSADGEYLVIRTADQDFGFLRPDENMYRLDEKEYQNRIRRLPLNKDDIVYGREGERWGLACLVPESNRYCLGQRMMQFRCNTDMILPVYAMWALNSRYVYLQGSVDTIGSTSPHVNISTMRNYNIPTPPLDEQREIVRYIDEKAAAIEKTIQKRTMLIDKMTAYKKSLIYEVVTGKREVI